MKFNKIELVNDAERAAYKALKDGAVGSELANTIDKEMTKVSQGAYVGVIPAFNAFLYDTHMRNRRPYYRMWPGFVENIDRLNVPCICPDFDITTKTLEIDFADHGVLTRWHDEDIEEDIKMQLEAMLLFPIWPQVEEKKLYWLVMPQDRNQEGHRNHGYTIFDNARLGELPSIIPKLIYALYLVVNNPDIVRPLVLAKDREKFEQSGDKKYIDKAVRNGVIGFDVGRDIPTKADIARMRQENAAAMANGKKCPHIRASHLHLYWTGKGRVKPEIKLIHEAFVNWEQFKEIPQGYHEEEKDKRKGAS